MYFEKLGKTISIFLFAMIYFTIQDGKISEGDFDTVSELNGELGQPESLGREKVEEVEKLLQVVLQRSSCQQQFVLQWVVVQDAEKLKRDIIKQS